MNPPTLESFINWGENLDPSFPDLQYQSSEYDFLNWDQLLEDNFDPFDPYASALPNGELEFLGEPLKLLDQPEDLICSSAPGCDSDYAGVQSVVELQSRVELLENKYIVRPVYLDGI